MFTVLTVSVYSYQGQPWNSITNIKTFFLKRFANSKCSKISGETMVEARTLKIVAGIGAAAFLGYCIYFDKKRRSAPDFREKLKGKS